MNALHQELVQIAAASRVTTAPFDPEALEEATTAAKQFVDEAFRQLMKKLRDPKIAVNGGFIADAILEPCGKCLFDGVPEKHQRNREFLGQLAGALAEKLGPPFTVKVEGEYGHEHKVGGSITYPSFIVSWPLM